VICRHTIEPLSSRRDISDRIQWAKMWILMGTAKCCLQKFELEKKLVSGKVRSGKGKKKAEKASRRAQREASAAATADASMADAPKATKGLGSSRTQTKRAATAMDTDA